MSAMNADFASLNFVKLLEKDPSELSRLLSACEKDGFFYLNLEDWNFGRMLQEHDATHTIMKEWFRQPDEEKLRTETISDAHG